MESSKGEMVTTYLVGDVIAETSRVAALIKVKDSRVQTSTPSCSMMLIPSSTFVKSALTFTRPEFIENPFLSRF